MRRTIHAFRNYAKHAHEDRTFRWALVVLAALLAIIAIAYKPATIYVLDGNKCRPYIGGFKICPVSPPPVIGTTIGPKG